MLCCVELSSDGQEIGDKLGKGLLVVVTVLGEAGGNKGKGHTGSFVHVSS